MYLLSCFSGSSASSAGAVDEEFFIKSFEDVSKVQVRCCFATNLYYYLSIWLPQETAKILCLLLVSQNEIRKENDLEKMKKMQYISLSFNSSKDVPCICL